ncbi:MAG: hypothetical protein WC608_00715 [Parcubacteria group bacterium]
MSIALAKNWGGQTMPGRAVHSGKSFRLVKTPKKGAKKISQPESHDLKTGIFFLAVCFFVAGSAYLYQVNGIVAKGYEIREKETRIQELEKESQQLKIKEVELKSMYNIEKSMDDLNLVTSAGVSYIEENEPMAMK